MLVGEKVILRPLERSDLSLVAAWRNDPEVRKHFFSPYLIAQSGQESWYEDYLRRRDSLIYIVSDREKDARVGMVGLDHIDPRNQSAEYGRMLIADPASRGKGYARDATMTLIHYAFHDLNLHRIYLRVFADNAEALKLYERCGFEREGTERDAVYMGGCFRDVVLMSVLRRERLSTPEDHQG
jgi:diamine N-acetyltransferase